MQMDDPTTMAAARRILDEAKTLSRLDFPTLQAAVALVSSMGLKHYQLSKDTRLPMEARKAHRFVALNCEELSRKFLRMSGLAEREVEEVLREITRQTVEFHRTQQTAVKAHSATQPGPNGTGTA